MEEIYIKARAKVNLTLNVLEKREDNYHKVESIFQKINLYDELYITKKEEKLFELSTNIEALNNDENILFKAYMKLKQRYQIIKGVKVILKKNIPMQAGLAGGSTDCAAFLIAMNKLYELDLSEEELVKLGASLGADVVPCFYNQALKAEGIGDKITKINTDFKYYFVIIKPNISFSTKMMFQKLDQRKKIRQINNTENMIKALENKSIKMIADNLYNVFEDVAEDNQIQQIKNELLEHGAMASLMSGSGSCIYGVFKNRDIAKQAYYTLKERYETYFCIAFNPRKIILNS